MRDIDVASVCGGGKSHAGPLSLITSHYFHVAILARHGPHEVPP